MDIVVLAGGLSMERDVSLSTSTKVCNALRQKGHRAILLDVYLGYPGNAADIETIFDIDITEELPPYEILSTVPDIAAIKAQRTGKSPSYLGPNVAAICQKADIVHMGLHGDVGENGQLQATLDLLGVKYTGSGHLGSALAMHKGLTKQVFETTDVPTPPGYLLRPDDEKNLPSDHGLDYPVVVKPCSGGSSIGVDIVHNEADYKKALEASFCYEDSVLVEAYIKGREFSIGIIGDHAYPLIEIIPKTGFYSYENKYQDGRTIEICPAGLSEKYSRPMQECAKQVFQALQLDVYARVDFLLDEDNNFYCLEANTLPGMTPLSLLPQEAAAEGLTYEDLCDLIIRESLKKYN